MKKLLTAARAEQYITVVQQSAKQLAGSLGGKAAWGQLTAEQRCKKARHMANARWLNHEKKPPAPKVSAVERSEKSRKAALAFWKGLTPAQHRKRVASMSQARWSKRKKKAPQSHAA